MFSWKLKQIRVKPAVHLTLYYPEMSSSTDGKPAPLCPVADSVGRADVMFVQGCAGLDSDTDWTTGWEITILREQHISDPVNHPVNWVTQGWPNPDTRPILLSVQIEILVYFLTLQQSIQYAFIFSCVYLWDWELEVWLSALSVSCT